MVQHIVDVGAGGHRVVDVLVPSGVSGADNPVARPRDDEQHGLLSAQEDTGLSLNSLLGNHNVDTLTGQHLQTVGDAS